MPAPYLFLHGGPAMSAIVERAWYADCLLPVDWWDQPRDVAVAPSPYQTLVDAARTRLDAASAASGTRIALLAHSFGAQVALDLIATDAHHIDSLTLLAPAHDMRHVWLKLAQLQQKHGPLPALQEAAARFARECTDEAAMAALWQALASIPTLFDCYWAATSSEQMARHQRLIKNSPEAFDFAAFTIILTDYLRQETRRASTATMPTDLPVQIWYGHEDHIVDSATGSVYWWERFPRAKIGKLPCGHFIQFEQPLASLLNAHG